MSRVFTLELSTEKRDELANLLEEQRYTIFGEWQHQRFVKSVFDTKQINADFFINHFGSRVLNYFISVLRRDKVAGQCPVMIVMLKFFANRHMKLDDIYHICSGMKNSVVYTLHANGIAYSDDKITAAVELFDANFSGVIREYTNIISDEHQNILREKILQVEADQQQIALIKEYMQEEMKVDESVSDNTINTTKDQCVVNEQIDERLLEKYFAADEDDGEEKILFRTDDSDDMLEYFSEVSERLSFAIIHSDPSEIIKVANIFSKTSSILLHYTPYLDSLAASMNELSSALLEHTDSFMEVLKNTNDGTLKLFDAVSADMDRYIQRFSVESIAMKNSHHIHEPTTLSIRQIVRMFAPDQIEEGEIEFF